MAALSLELCSLIYDGRLAILPVFIRMPDLVVDNVALSGGLPSVGILHLLPGRFGRFGRSGPVSMGDSEPAIMSEFSSDTDPYMEDKLCRFQPLQAAVSPLYTTTDVIRRQRCPWEPSLSRREVRRL